MTINKEQFWELAKRPFREKVVEFDKVEYRLREMSEADSADLEVKLQTKSGDFSYWKHRRLTVALCLVDDEGNRIVDDPEKLASLGKTLIGKLYAEALKLNDYEERELESLAKKSEGADADG